MHAGGGLLAFHGGKAHLTAGHAEVGVVHNDNSYVSLRYAALKVSAIPML